MRKSGQSKDYSLWVKDLYNFFGKENVLVLLMEDIGKIDFWLNIKSFCDLTEFEPETMLRSRGDNKRRKGENIWAIQPFESDFKAEVWAENIFRLAWPYRLKKDLRESTRQAVVKMFQNYFESSLYNTNSETREK